MMTINVEDIFRNILRMIKPDENERKYLYELFNKIRRNLEACLLNTNKSFNITLQGSLAKDTFIKGHVDIDIFVLFQPFEVDNEWINKTFISLILGCLQNDYKLVVKYASHPYVTAYVNDVEINIVPAYNIESPNNIISAVDRTPFHTKYIISKLNDTLKDEIRILKYFLAVWNLYGAEINIQGFSGYLTELLILKYGGFLNLLKESQKWKAYKVCIDIERHYKDEKECLRMFRNDVLVVVDPIDPKRNVAAAVSLKTFSIFKLLAKLFLEKPSQKFFDKKQEEIFLDIDYISNYAKERIRSTESCLVGIELEITKPIPDIVWGQLNRIERIIKNVFKSHGIKSIYIDTWIDNEFRRAIIMIEVFNCNINYEFRKGPPSYITDEAVNFIVKNKDALAGPWLDDDGILYCIKKRRYRPSEIVALALRDLILSSLKIVRYVESMDALPLYNADFRRWFKQFLDRKIFKSIIELL